MRKRKFGSIGVSERLTYFAKHLGTSLEALEKAANLSQGYIKSTSKSIGIDELNKILSRFPELSKDWLLYVRGDMLKYRAQNGDDYERTKENGNISSSSAINNPQDEYLGGLRVKRKEINEIAELIKKENALISRHIAKESKLIDQFCELVKYKFENGRK